MKRMAFLLARLVYYLVESGSSYLIDPRGLRDFQQEARADAYLLDYLTARFSIRRQ
jgi:hypothetical protein